MHRPRGVNISGISVGDVVCVQDTPMTPIGSPVPLVTQQGVVTEVLETGVVRVQRDDNRIQDFSLCGREIGGAAKFPSYVWKRLEDAQDYFGLDKAYADMRSTLATLLQRHHHCPAGITLTQIEAVQKAVQDILNHAPDKTDYTAY